MEDNKNVNPVHSNTVYVAVQGSPYEASVPEASAYSYTVVPREPHKRRACGCGACLCLLTVFLAFFFLVPRTPLVYLEQVTANKHTSTSTGETSVAIAGSFEFENNNYFDVNWSNPTIDLYWLPTKSSGTFIAEACSGSSTSPYEACEYYQDGLCAINIGSFSKGAKFTTNPRADVHQKLDLEQTSKQLACSANMIGAAVLQSQLLFSKGSVAAEGMVRNFGNVAVSDVYYSFA